VLLARGSKSYLACKASYGAGGYRYTPPDMQTGLTGQINGNGKNIISIPVSENYHTLVGVNLDT
jgi:hypothetical protein